MYSKAKFSITASHDISQDFCFLAYCEVNTP